MSGDNLTAFQPLESSASLSDALSELVHQGARQIIAQAVEAELAEFLAQYQNLKDEQGKPWQGCFRLLVCSVVGYIKLPMSSTICPRVSNRKPSPRTPAQTPKRRGKSPGWTQGQPRTPRVRAPIVKKRSSKRKKQAQTSA